MTKSDRHMNKWLQQALEYKGLSQAKLSAILAGRPGWSGARAKINKIANGRQSMSAQEMYDIAEVTGYPIPPILQTDNIWKAKLHEALQAAIAMKVEKDQIRLDLAEAFTLVEALTAQHPERIPLAERLAERILSQSRTPENTDTPDKS